MKLVKLKKIVLVFVLLALFFPKIAYCIMEHDEKIEMRDTLYKITTSAYQVGYHTCDCEKATIGSMILLQDLEKEDPEFFKAIILLIWKSCEIGASDRVHGEYRLPELLHRIDEEVEKKFTY